MYMCICVCVYITVHAHVCVCKCKNIRMSLYIAWVVIFAGLNFHGLGS